MALFRLNACLAYQRLLVLAYLPSRSVRVPAYPLRPASTPGRLSRVFSEEGRGKKKRVFVLVYQ